MTCGYPHSDCCNYDLIDELAEAKAELADWKREVGALLDVSTKHWPSIDGHDLAHLVLRIANNKRARAQRRG